MASLTQAIRTYSYIDRTVIDFGTADPNDTNTAMLARIEALMTAAAASFNTRQYNDAITTYHAAESLIYSQLDPQWEPELGPKIRPFLPRDPSLFSPLLSSTSQWLNILAVPSAASPVRPTSAVNPSLLSTASNVHGAGLNVVDPNAANASEALADMRLAAIYADEGNTGASSVAVTRAQGLDPTLATALNPKPAGNTLAAASAGGFVASPALTLNPSADLTAFQIPIESHPTLPITVLTQKQLGLITGSAGQYTVQSIQWAANTSPDISQITSIVYAAHAAAVALPDALNNVSTIWERATLLPHDYFYIIPLALAECYEALGDYANAEKYFLQAASYTYINTAASSHPTRFQRSGKRFRRRSRRSRCRPGIR